MTAYARSLPAEAWPKADRLAWETACRPARRLVRGGAAGHMALATQEDLANRYGLFLDYLERVGSLDHDAEAAAQVTPAEIPGFIIELRGRVSSVTVSRTIYKVRRAAECVAPGRDFAWLAEIGKDLVLLERSKEDFGREVSPVRLVEAGLSLMQKAESTTGDLRRTIAARNGLMIALLALTPIRLRNCASLEVGRSLLPSEGAWWIVLEDTKAGRPDHRPVPDFLNCHLGTYLCVCRPALLSSGAHHSNGDPSRDAVIPPTTDVVVEPISALWISNRGTPLSYGAVERIITETTRKALGVPVNPHRFRKAAASFAALNASSSPYLGSALLQHADPRQTYEHYIRASSLSASQDFANVIAELRKPISLAPDGVEPLVTP